MPELEVRAQVEAYAGQPASEQADLRWLHARSIGHGASRSSTPTSSWPPSGTG